MLTLIAQSAYRKRRDDRIRQLEIEADILKSEKDQLLQRIEELEDRAAAGYHSNNNYDCSWPALLQPPIGKIPEFCARLCIL